jgi:hypothetical protein
VSIFKVTQCQVARERMRVRCNSGMAVTVSCLAAVYKESFIREVAYV